MVVVRLHSKRSDADHAGRHDPLPHVQGRGHLGSGPADHVGLGHHQLRLVDRHWPRGNAHFRDSLSAAPALAHSRQPRRRSDDDFHRHVRRHFSAHSHRAHLVWLVAVAVAQREQHLAAVPLAADVGRVRRLDLFHGVRALLVYGLDS